MNSKTALTKCAHLAMDELFHLHFVGQQITGDTKYDESLLQERNKKWPDITPVTNEGFNHATDRLLGIFQLCYSIDIYNWYCRETLKVALASSTKLFLEVIRQKEGKMTKMIAKAERSGINAADKIIERFLSGKYAGDKVIRDTIHHNLDVFQNPEIELLCTCRNVLVHQCGYDEFGKIKAEIEKLGDNRALIGAQWFPSGHMPIALNKESYLIIDQGIGAWANELLQKQIFMMDQNFAYIYKLPRDVRERQKIGRTFLGK
ncbi:MAG: hypothetical protein M3Y82_14570 [Verrucomicrobiota bacterium]|nr:hypothetical protein [Verrucomicrobiota bacterium]